MKKHIKKLRIVMPIVAVICAVLFTPWALFWTWIAPLPSTIQEQLDKAINQELDGIVVYVDKAGEVPAFYTAGWNNRDEKTPADVQAYFKIASISKLYVAVATAKQVASNHLNLDGSLAELLPEYADSIAYSHDITLRMMVQHRSGIPNYSDHPDYPWASPPKKDYDNLKLVLNEPADFKPDSRYKYSNTNYMLIGAILDKTLGYGHQQFIKKEILEPLGLSNTYGVLSDVPIEDVCSGYYVGYDKDIKYNDFIGVGGSMVATIADVGVFLRALNDGAILTKKEQAIYSSIYKFEHTGLLPGYSSIARYHQDIDAVVIQFVNTSGGNSWTLSSINYKRVVRILNRVYENAD